MSNYVPPRWETAFYAWSESKALERATLMGAWKAAWEAADMTKKVPLSLLQERVLEAAREWGGYKSVDALTHARRSRPERVLLEAVIALYYPSSAPDVPR